jgi:DHA1 family bicyclomycin/chloramphenicol resistance-like MFS transporter
MVIGSQSNVFLLRWFSPSAILSTGLVITAMSGAALVALLAADASLLLVLLPVFMTVTSQGFVLPNATALALGRMPRHTGSAAAVLGVSQFLLGAVIPPLVSLLGRNGAVMGSTILGCAAVALLLLVAAGRLTYWSRRDA